MSMDAQQRGQRYLAHLSDADQRLLLRAGAGPEAADHLPTTAERIEELLGHDAVFEAVFAPDEDDREPLVGVSPFLAFAVAVHRARRELADMTYVEEWSGVRQRVPVFATDELRGFLDEPDHRLFLAELLASYTNVTGGAVTVRRGGTIHRRRFSELDLGSLAGLLNVVTEESRPGLYRRLGDLALFMTGVFPDRTARHSFAPIEVDRLAHALRPAGDVSTEELLDALSARGAIGLLEQLGRRWYGLALRTAPVRTATLQTLQSVGERFEDARRVLNHITDRHLFPVRGDWFPSAN